MLNECCVYVALNYIYVTDVPHVKYMLYKCQNTSI